MTVRKPLIVGIGGTTRPGSSSECALQFALRTVEAGGGETRLLGGEFLSHLPIFNPANADQTDEQKLLADTVRQADGVIVARPGYHGSISGVIKNALDTLEVLRHISRLWGFGVKLESADPDGEHPVILHALPAGQ